jgi:hypothetical protein
LHSLFLLLLSPSLAVVLRPPRLRLLRPLRLKRLHPKRLHPKRRWKRRLPLKRLPRLPLTRLLRRQPRKKLQSNSAFLFRKTAARNNSGRFFFVNSTAHESGRS